MSRLIDLTGQRIGTITVLKMTHHQTACNLRTAYKVKCDCGKKFLVESRSILRKLNDQFLPTCQDCLRRDKKNPVLKAIRPIRSTVKK